MEHASQTLIVITLLQLCRAEISEIIHGTWFSANAINDGYSPKPILDLFTTDPTSGFSPTQPIVVLSSSSQPESEVSLISTSSPDYISSSTPLPPTSNSPSYSSSYLPSTQFPPTATETTFETSSTPFPSSKQSTLFTGTSSTTTPGRESVTTVFPPPANFPVFNFPNSPKLSSRPPLTNFAGAKFTDLVSPLPTLSTFPPVVIPQTSSTVSPNFPVNYDNTPPQTFHETSSRGPLLFPPTLTTKSLTQTSLSTDTIAPYITNTFSDGTSRPTVTFRSTPPATSIFTTPRPTLVSTVTQLPTSTAVNITLPTRRPIVFPRVPQIIPGPPNGTFAPNLKIRIVAPKGSITNVKFNPVTTTRKPTTRKPKKNTYDACVDHCRGRKDPICTIPLGTQMVEPDMLKGFPSICHMACHNSFRKIAYEKLIDGRCGKLRTRIIRVDSNTKIQREELKKSQYSIINTGPKTVIELASALFGDIRRKK